MKSRLSLAIAVLLALVPFAYLVRMCLLRGVDVPFWDEWEMVTRLDHLHSGALTFQDFWGQHNEHRPVFPVIVLLTLARLTDWDVRWEIGANVAVGIAIFAVYLVYLRNAWRTRGGVPLGLIPVVSGLAFTPAQWENWLWGWQIGIFMCVLASLGAAYLIAGGAENVRRFAGAVACGVCATYSFAAGLVVWPAMLPGIWLQGGRRRVARTVMWLAAAAIVYGSYFYDFERPYQAPLRANFASFEAFRRCVTYAFTYIGTPFGSYDPLAAPMAGLAGVVLFAALLVRLRSLHRDSAYAFPALIGIQALGNATASALGRAWFGVDQAMSSHYTTLSLPLWCAIVFLASIWWTIADAPVPARRRALVTLAAALVTAALGASFARSSRGGAYVAAAHAGTLRVARRGLITGESDALLLRLFPRVDVIRERRAIVMRLRLSVFRPSAQPSDPPPGPR